MLMDYFLEAELPILGVCRGMQVIQERAGIRLEKIDGHVKTNHTLFDETEGYTVNSFHNFGTKLSSPELLVEARAEDGIVEAIRHIKLNMHGIMWHPERVTPFAERDIQFFKNVFGGKS